MTLTRIPVAATAAVLAFASWGVYAQTAPATDPSAASATAEKQKADQAVVLNPFEVKETADHGYGANESNSITQFKTNLFNAPITADIFNQELMRDLNATSVETLVLQYGGGGVQTNDAGAAGAFNTRPGDNVGSTNLTLRGDKVSIHRDGFQSATNQTKGLIGSTDNFSVDRGELIHGASSLLYGDSGGGGVLNLVSKQAILGGTAKGGLDYTLDQYGSKRAVLDYGVGSGDFALRLALLDGNSSYKRSNLGGPSEGRYLQVAFKLPLNTILRISNMRTLVSVDNSFIVGNVNNFLSTTDPRRNQDLRYLVATGQTQGLEGIYSKGLTLDNVDSFGGWWKADREEDTYTNAVLETAWNPWLSTSIGIAYDDATSDGPSGLGSLTPAAGLANSGTNPLPETAINLSTPGDSLSNTHRFGTRASVLATNDFFHGVAHSQTIAGGEVTRQAVSNGIAYIYALSDAHGNLVVNPNTLATDNGLTVLTTSPSLWYGVQDGLVAKPLFKPTTPIIALPDPNNPGAVLYYTHTSRRTGVPSLVSPLNPNGVNGSAGGYTRQDVQTHAYYVANQTEWWGGRLETLAGVRYSDQYSANIGVNSSAVSVIRAEKPTYTLGASYAIVPTLRCFTDLSTSTNPQLNTQSPYGIPNLSSEGRSPAPDFGLKFQSPERHFEARVTYYPDYTLYHDAVGIDTTYVSQINPTGINGAYEPLGLAPNSQVNVDRKSNGLELSFTVHVKRWDSFLNLGTTSGTYLNTVSFKQVYNDQFRASNGTVVYADGVTPVMVDPLNKGAKTGLVPLTVAMLNTVGNPWAAQPNADSGAIGNSSLKTALESADPANLAIGPSATGATGLPLSNLQYDFTDPNGHNGLITVIKAGDKQTGIPKYTLGTVNRYNVINGKAQGLAVGVTASVQWEYANNYGELPAANGSTVNANAQRFLYYRPTVALFGSFLRYRRKIFGFDWSTQLNVSNLFNHYRVLTPPNTAISPPNVNYLQTAEPRSFAWTNSVAF